VSAGVIDIAANLYSMFPHTMTSLCISPSQQDRGCAAHAAHKQVAHEQVIYEATRARPRGGATCAAHERVVHQAAWAHPGDGAAHAAHEQVVHERVIHGARAAHE